MNGAELWKEVKVEAALLAVQPSVRINTAERFQAALASGWRPSDPWFAQDKANVRVAFDSGYRLFFKTQSVSLKYVFWVLDSLTLAEQDLLRAEYPSIREFLLHTVAIEAFLYSELEAKFGVIPHPGTLIVNNHTEWLVKDRHKVDWMRKYKGTYGENRIRCLYMHQGKRGYFLLPESCTRYRQEPITPISNQELYRLHPQWYRFAIKRMLAV